MFEKEVDEIYELCKRVVNEVPTASITFEHSSHGLNVRGVKRKKIIEVLGNEFNWDLYQTINFDYLSEREIREKVEIIKTFLLELLIDGRCPLNAESDRAEPDKDLALSFATTYTESSQRTQYGVGYFTPMFTVEQYTYKGSDLPMEEATKILQMVAKGHKFTLHYFSPYYGVWRDAPFYVGQTQNIAIGELSDDRKLLSSLEFNMTGVNPL